MARWGRFGWLVMALAPVAAFADDVPQVVVAQPGVGGGAIERFTLSFNQPMVALGDPRAAAPFKTGCAGTGRWVDQTHWVYEFAPRSPGARPAPSTPVTA